MFLAGENLGARHRHLNSVVNEAYRQSIPMHGLRDMPENTPLDRLFKIHLASKYHDVGYIIENLKDIDMLYVSTALKCTWLLDSSHSDIIKPSYLEDVLYPEMTVTAVNKMRHWIHLNLKDVQRSEEFYLFYKSKNIDLAIKFLSSCSNDFILRNIPEIIDKLKPQRLKILCEKCPEVAKVYFDSFQSNITVVSNYLNNEKKYFNNLRPLLKLNADIYLDIAERYFNTSSFKAFSSEATRYIMTNHKSRFTNKPELYTAWLLDINTLGKYLNKDEIKDLIRKLARAKYLSNWFSYKNIEPLIKCLNVDQRTQLKKEVFIDKSFGDPVDNWPYEPPSPPKRKYAETHVFEEEIDPKKYEYLVDYGLEDNYCFRKVLKKRKYCKYIKSKFRKTSLDLLFDNYRFMNFEKTLFELRKKIAAADLKSRQNMMLVLVSKSGERAENIAELLTLLASRHRNEPANLRATIVRSLVRRCCVWRLPQTTWEALLMFGYDLGLDGSPSTVACSEGLHAVVLRNILLDQCTELAIQKAYFEQFSTLQEYSLTAAERKVVAVKLPALLLSAAETNPTQAFQHLQKVLDVLDSYKIRADQYPGVVSAIAAFASRDTSAQLLLRRLFDRHISRRDLFIENFKIIQNDASYLNALRHDVNVLASGDNFEVLVKSNKLQHLKFLRSLALYFGEKNGLAERYLSILEKEAAVNPGNRLARHLAILIGDKLLPTFRRFYDSPKGSASKRFASALMVNAHLARPLLDLNTVKWKTIGATAIANRIVACSARDGDRYLEALLAWRRTMRVALLLSTRIGKEPTTFGAVAAIKPKLALTTALLYMRRGIATDQRLWDVVIPLIAKVDKNINERVNNRLMKNLNNVSIVPKAKLPLYLTKVFDFLQKIPNNAELIIHVLHNIEMILPEVDEETVEKIIHTFLNEVLIADKLPEDNHIFEISSILNIRIIVKYLLLCKSAEDQTNRLRNIGEILFQRLEEIWNKPEMRTIFMNYIDEVVISMSYLKVFFDTQYVSCIPVIQRTLEWMQKLLPLEMHFEKYVRMHLTMLYYKAIRQSVKNNPLVFKSITRKLAEGPEIVGYIFGKYVAREIIELTEKYFDSIRQMYKVELVDYLGKYFSSDSSRTKLIEFLMKGILSYENNKAHLLAEYIYVKESHEFTDTIRDDLFKMLKGTTNEEMLFYLYGEHNN